MSQPGGGITKPAAGAQANWDAIVCGLAAPAPEESGFFLGEANAFVEIWGGATRLFWHNGDQRIDDPTVRMRIKGTRR
jgi:hypothetical protein